jgi:hypothetical protein
LGRCNAISKLGEVAEGIVKLEPFFRSFTVDIEPIEKLSDVFISIKPPGLRVDA